MTQFHAVMLDECGHEFGADVTAADKAEARDLLREMYPENRGIVQLESPDDAQARQTAIYDRMMNSIMYDDQEDYY